jgi:hypothetical protein
MRPEIVQLIDLALVSDKGERWKTAAAMRLALSATAQEVLGANRSRRTLAAFISNEPRPEAPTAFAETGAPASTAGPSRGVEPTLSDPVSTVHMTAAWATPAPQAGMAPRHAGLTTAQPVAQDGPPPGPIGHRRSLAVAGLAVVAVAAIGVAATVLLVGGRGWNRTGMNGPSAQSVPATPPAAATATTVQTPEPKPVESMSTHSISVDQLPAAQVQDTPKPSMIATAPPAASSTTAAAPTTPAQPPSTKPDCRQPYEVDSQGHKRWKLQCL